MQLIPNLGKLFPFEANRKNLAETLPAMSLQSGIMRRFMGKLHRQNSLRDKSLLKKFRKLARVGTCT